MFAKSKATLMPTNTIIIYMYIFLYVKQKPA